MWFCICRYNTHFLTTHICTELCTYAKQSCSDLSLLCRHALIETEIVHIESFVQVVSSLGHLLVWFKSGQGI